MKRALAVFTCFVALLLASCGEAALPATDMPIPLTATLLPPTDTPIPPTDTPIPPTETPMPPTETPKAVQPTAAATPASAEGNWTTRADMPTGRWDYYTCEVHGKIYAIGGAGPVYQALRSVEVYDPGTDTWTAKSEMPTARQGLSTSVVNGKIYAIGGGAGSSSSYARVETFSTVEEYDPATDTWTTKSPMPTARGFHSANVVDGKIYIIGGSQASSPDRNHVLTVEVYDAATDTWSEKGDMPVSRAAGSSSVVDGKIYVIDGYGGARRVDEYDPSTDTWTTKSEMPTARHALSTSVLDGKIYAIGGYVPGVGGYPGLATVEVYDTATDTWMAAPDMPTARFGPRTSVVDEKIYVIGGMGIWGGSAYGTVEEYDPLPVSAAELLLTFDGERCTYEGPTVLKAGQPVTLLFRNETEDTAVLNLVRLLGDKTYQDVVDYTGDEPSSKHAPSWSADVIGVYRNVSAGGSHSWDGVLDPGIHGLVCGRAWPLGIWLGGELTVEE